MAWEVVEMASDSVHRGRLDAFDHENGSKRETSSYRLEVDRQGNHRLLEADKVVGLLEVDILRCTYSDLDSC